LSTSNFTRARRERAIETAALMLGSDRSRGYCLEMICADFLAQQQAFLGDVGGGFMSPTRPDPRGLRLDALSHERLRQQVLRRDGWRCQLCGAMSNLEVHHNQFRSHSGHDSEDNLIKLCAQYHAGIHH
jgi:hypothetical protein